MGSGGSKGPETLRLLAVLGVVLLIGAAFALRPASGQTSSSTAAGGAPSYVSPTSWAIGVVVPKNAQVVGGGGFSWGEVNNVTAKVALPQINQTDGQVGAVLSLMTTDGSVLQLAAGINPATDEWLTYAQFISDITATSANYQTIDNGSMPEMSPGDVVVLSIFASSGSWSYGLTDLNSHRSTQAKFPGGEAPLAAGAQEAFALESYSENSSVFAHMGNLTLQSLTIDGMRVVQGLYIFSNLDWQNDPLFVVGGYAQPPYFISVQRAVDGSVVWSYAGGWTGQSPPLALTILAAMAVFVAATLIYVKITRTGGQLASQAKRESANQDTP